jgi:hypothetical protein
MRGANATYNNPTIKIGKGVCLDYGTQGYIYYTANDNRLKKLIFFADNYDTFSFMSISQISSGGSVYLSDDLVDIFNKGYLYIYTIKRAIYFSLTEDYIITKNFKLYCGYKYTEDEVSILRSDQINIDPLNDKVLTISENVILTIQSIKLDINRFVKGYAYSKNEYFGPTYEVYPKLAQVLPKSKNVYAISQQAVEEVTMEGVTIEETESLGYGGKMNKIVCTIFKDEDLNYLWYKLIVMTKSLLKEY